MAGLAAAHGLPREAALRAVTLGAAEVLGIDRDRGSLDVGKVANVAIFTGDPLQPLARVERLFVRGREVALESRQMELYRKFAPLALPAAKQK
jgi:imidazolonepropionase-like amidohydrolase